MDKVQSYKREKRRRPVKLIFVKDQISLRIRAKDRSASFAASGSSKELPVGGSTHFRQAILLDAGLRRPSSAVPGSKSQFTDT